MAIIDGREKKMIEIIGAIALGAGVIWAKKKEYKKSGWDEMNTSQKVGHVSDDVTGTVSRKIEDTYDKYNNMNK